jgi:hypothetical protein
MSFENLLLSKGYVPHGLKKFNGNVDWVPLEKYFYSTMGNSWIKFIKQDKYFVYGLSEANKPPTLIKPRPLIINENFIRTVYFDDDMNKIFINYTAQEIYDAILNEKPLLLEGSETEKIFKYSL